MLALGIRFLAGRFHATPWGRHVNEGAPEWPPSPWRLLRALVATWKRKLDNDATPSDFESVIRALASSLPRYLLPPASTGHTRHYMPWFKKGPADRTLVFDAFVACDRTSELVVFWPEVTLDEAQVRALDRLAGAFSFLGRAESWAELRRLSDSEASGCIARANCAPAGSPPTGEPQEAVRVLCPDPTSAFGNEHTPAHELVEGRGRAKRVIRTPLYDPDWHLCLETLVLHEERWSDPPGSRWVTYHRPRSCFVVSSRGSRPGSDRPRPTVARFALDAVVLPLVQDTLRVAETARITAMGCYRRAEERRLYPDGQVPRDAPLPRSAILAGKDDSGIPLEGHGHARYLPTDEDGDGRLDHLTIVADLGFGSGELQSLDRMRSLRRDEGEPVNLLLLGIGEPSAFPGCPVLAPARDWIAATPFLAPRHPKRRGKKKDPPELLGPDHHRAFARQVLVEELARLRVLRPEIPEPLSIEPLDDEHRLGARRLRPIQFRRFRRKRGDDGGRRAAGAFRIRFPEPVAGPICLGHSSHFGLGLFVAGKG